MKEGCFRKAHAFEDSSHLGCDILLFFEWFLMSWSVAHYTYVVPHLHHWLFFLDSNSWDEGIVYLQNVWKYSPIDIDWNSHVYNNQMW